MNHGPGLTFRFLAAQVLVVVISLLVAAAVATMVGPILFHDHMLMTGREDPRWSCSMPSRPTGAPT